MVWETLIVCITVYLLFGDYMKEKAHYLEAEAELMEAEADVVRNHAYRKEE